MLGARKLTLKRDVLQELTGEQLAGVVAGTFDTLYSCYGYQTCDIVRCLIEPAP